MQRAACAAQVDVGPALTKEPGGAKFSLGGCLDVLYLEGTPTKVVDKVDI